MSDLIDPYSPIQSTDDADRAYSSVLMAAESNDPDLAIRLAGELIDSTWTRPEHRFMASLYVGQCLMRAQRYEESDNWLRTASNGPAEVAEQAFNTLAELARWQGASTGDIDFASGPPRHLQAAQEALARGDFGGAATEAVRVFEYDDSSAYQRAAASLVAAEGLYRQGNDNQAELYAEWAAAHGDADQQSSARSMRAEWAAYRAADTGMDGGLQGKEHERVLAAAETAANDRDHARVVSLLEELRALQPALTASQQRDVHVLLGDAYRHLRRYDEAITELEQVTDDSLGHYANQIADIRRMQQLGEQI